MSNVIAISNQKGGVGKTTTASALISGLARKGYSVLGVDLDPQGNLSEAFGADAYEKPTVYELIKREVSPKEVAQRINRKKGLIDIIPSNIMLAGAEQELYQTGKEYRLKEVIQPVFKNYDYIIIDTPPSLGILTVNALSFASEVIVPTNAGIFAVRGIKQLFDTINNVKKYCNPDVKISGILMTKYNPRTNIGKQIKELTEQLGETIKAPVFNTYIRASVVVEESQANRISLFEVGKRSTVSDDYSNFVDEYLKSKEL